MSPRIKQFEDSLEIIKKRFGKLQQDLVLKEDYIKYLEKEILIRNEKLDPLRLLEKFQDDIDILDKKIKILISYKNDNKIIDMA
ncbi:17225_t:CDS:2 [Entrophospora sp. SA101]|nr:17225_t:CDS:2 [Entrophospora sp. SA101]CAJ0827113.1 1454_t:CDS:2 [Entrophospora sp. SA101]CAJ0864606.1 18848_t:CDS:2 [Entrophospora sp. SA101]